MNIFEYDSPKLWYLKTDLAERTKALDNYIKLLQNKPAQIEQLETWEVLERMYGVKSNVAQTIDVFADSSKLQRMKLNAIKSVIDTTVNKVGKNKPLPYFLTSGGNFDAQIKAKNLSKFVEGCFYEADMFDIGRDVLRNALLYGTGIVKPYIEDNKQKFEICKNKNLLIDQDEAIFIRPQQYHELGSMTRTELIKKYPKFEGEINLADSIKNKNSENPETYTKDTNDIIEVRESWVLGKKEDDICVGGKHVISISSVILLEEEYKKDYPAHIIFNWDKPLIGFWGTGMAENIQSFQVSINKTLRVLQLAIHLTAIPKVFLQKGTGLPKAHLNNKIGGIIEYNGVKPSYESVAAVPPELMNFLQWQIEQIYQQTGVSLLSAQSLKPTGLNSGKALNTFNDIESERFLTYGQKYEDFFLELAFRCIEGAKDLEEQGVDVITKAHGDVSFEKMKWSEVKLDEDKYIMKAFPVSFFSTTPSAKWQEAQDMINAGALPVKALPKIMDFPDLKAVYNEINGQEHAIDQIIQGFTKGSYEAPDPYIDIDLAHKKVQDAYMQYKVQKLSEAKLDLFRQFLDEIAVIKSMQAQQMQAEAQDMEVQAALEEPVTPEEQAAIDQTIDPNLIGEE